MADHYESEHYDKDNSIMSSLPLGKRNLGPIVDKQEQRFDPSWKSYGHRFGGRQASPPNRRLEREDSMDRSHSNFKKLKTYLFLIPERLSGLQDDRKEVENPRVRLGKHW